MTALAIVFAVNFCLVFVRSFQQRNVMGMHYKAIWPTGAAFAVCDVYLIAYVAEVGFDGPSILAMWLGGTTGCTVSMYLHDKHMGENK